MSFENTTAAFADPETGALAKGLTMDAANIAKSRSEALAKYQSESRVREAALAAPDGNTPIEFIAENGNTVTLPASQILSLPRFSEETITSLQRGVMAPYEVAALDPLEVAARARAGQLQGNYLDDLADATGRFDTAKTQLGTGATTLGSAASLLTDEDSELADAFKGLTSASDLLTAKDGQIEGAFTDLGGARDRYAERIDRPDAYQTEAATALRNAITGAETATASGIGALGQLYYDTQGIGKTGAEGIRQAYADARPSLTSAQAQLAGQSAYGRTESEQAALRARQAAAAAQADLQSAGIYGLDQAKAAAEALGGTGAAFDPSGISAFYSPYEDYAVDKTLADIRRQGGIAQQDARAKAVHAGAFGGSRLGVQLSEMERGVLEQQARTAAQMRDAGYRQAAAQAQESFERQKGRQQNLAQLIGGLGQAGAATYAQAAQQFGGLGLSAEELAQRGALQAAGVGLQEGEALGRMGATYGQLQQTGEEAALRGQLSAQEMAARNAAQIAGLGQSQGDLQMRQGQAMGQLGLGYGQLGQQDIRTMSDMAKLRGDMGFQQSQMMADQAAQRGQLGLQQAQTLGQIGSQQGQVGALQGTQALQRASIGELESKLGTQELSNLASMGALGRTQEQALLEADRMNIGQELQIPYQGIGFATDVLAKVPSGSSVVQNTVPVGSSPFQQVAGLGIAGLSAAAGAKNLSLFG